MSDVLSATADLAAATNVIDVRRRVVEFARSRGFAAMFFISPIAKDSREGRVLANVGFDDTWARAYRRWLHRTDPLPEIALRRSAPFRWSEASKLRTLTAPEQRYLAILAARGMADGLIVPTFGPGSRCGMAGLGLHPNVAALSGAEVLELQIVAQASYARYCDLVSSEFEQDAPLSEREKDVLLWMSRGKSNAAIGIILDISADTVDTYVRRIFRKFSVSDRVAAVMAAVQHGYVIAGNYRKVAETDPAS
jgi:LuxR family transcriptional regulator, quorum-sensing system regulator CciR